VLVDLDWEGKQRKVLLHAERNGYLYLLDRATGEVLSADPFVRVTASKKVDLDPALPDFGRLIPDRDKKPKMGRVVKAVTPMHAGAKDWQPCAYSPKTGLLYIPHQTMAMDYEGVEANYVAGTPYVGANVKLYAGPVDPGDGSRGALTAWDPVARKQAWRIKEKFPVWCGAAATAGGVVFYDTMDRWFKAVDAETGQELWKYEVDSGIVGQPTTFRGPDGKQYVAILSGVGGWAGAIVSAELDPRDPSIGHGWGNVMKDLPRHTKKGGTLYVFSLP
jgi:glucose dehydrogenase